MRELLHEGTVLHTEYFYTIKRGKRFFYTSRPSTNDTYFRFNGFLYQPAMLVPSTWRRYDYTIEDVYTSFDRADVSYLWLLCVFYLYDSQHMEPNSNGVRPTFQNIISFLFISKRNVLDMYITKNFSHTEVNKQSVLAHERLDHHPLLPKVFVSSSVFWKLKTFVPSRQPSFKWLVTYPEKYRFKDIDLIPLSFDEKNQLLLMCRIIRKDVFDSINCTPSLCIVTLPITVKVRDEQFVLHEESCFFSAADKNNPRLLKKKKHTQKKQRPVQPRKRQKI